MRVKMLVTQAGPNVDRRTGQEYELPDNEAQQLITKGKAVPVTVRKVERAVKPPPEVRADDAPAPSKKKRRKKNRKRQQ